MGRSCMSPKFPVYTSWQDRCPGTKYSLSRTDVDVIIRTFFQWLGLWPRTKKTRCFSHILLLPPYESALIPLVFTHHQITMHMAHDRSAMGGWCQAFQRSGRSRREICEQRAVYAEERADIKHGPTNGIWNGKRCQRGDPGKRGALSGSLRILAAFHAIQIMRLHGSKHAKNMGGTWNTVHEDFTRILAIPTHTHTHTHTSHMYAAVLWTSVARVLAENIQMQVHACVHVCADIFMHGGARAHTHTHTHTPVYVHVCIFGLSSI